MKKYKMIYYHSSLLKRIVLAALLMPLLMNHANAQNDPSTTCPFKLNCTDNMKFLELPTHPIPLKLIIDISYEMQMVWLSDPGKCLPQLLLHHNISSFFPFISETFQYNVTFFNCSSVAHLINNFDYYPDGTQDMITCPIYVADSEYESVIEFEFVYCIKLFDSVSLFDAYSIRYNSITFNWSGTNFDTRCLECEHKSKKKIEFITLSSIGGIVGSTLLVIAIGAIVRIYHYFKMKGEDHERIENFLKDYKALKPTRFSYADIKRITHNFKEKLGEGAHGAVYKDGFYRALVYDFFPNGSLQKFISPQSNKDSFLGWDKLQQIAIGIANGIEYLHQGCEQRILHFDINPHNILIDDSFNPKITDFGLAKMCSKNQSMVSMTAAKGTLGYMAPEVFSRNFGNVSYKSDIYSYGMLLLEIVGGRKNTSTKTTTSEENFQVLYPDWIHTLLEGGDIHIPIDEDGDFRIAKKLAIVGLWCIQWQPIHRPSMKIVLQMLQGDQAKLKVPSNPFGPTTSTNTSSNIVMNLELEVIQEID
ncbi:rust resistance kinase Lr10-like isoform X2 [Cicer arietinum]|uniref:Rust resistance kinase Lr10-like isoform X2 n=1 Tax=Cicer arietinum TaxID=3827 RepID=A0A1S3E496_CICAR|nr:rust resistance kinase Lr10-like isoform X2 [Cicer arietinum]